MRVGRRIGQLPRAAQHETVFAAELTRRGLLVERQKVIPFEFDGMIFEEGLRVDLLVNGVVVVEVLLGVGWWRREFYLCARYDRCRRRRAHRRV